MHQCEVVAVCCTCAFACHGLVRPLESEGELKHDALPVPSPPPSPPLLRPQLSHAAAQSPSSDFCGVPVDGILRVATVPAANTPLLYTLSNVRPTRL